MQLNKIQEILAHYKLKLQNAQKVQHLYLYDVVYHFQANWGLAKEPLHEMIDQSIQSNISRTLWKKPNFDPKERMIAFAKLNPDFVAQMFRGLYDEDKSIDRRVDRFFHASEQMLQELKKAYPTSIVNNHYQDHSMVSLYLACQYPEKYAYYDKFLFVETLRHVKAKNFQTIDDLPRFFKMLNIFDTLIKKDPEIFALHLMRLEGDHFYKGYTRNMITEALLLFFEDHK